jgi:predicted phage gp36 major capsid-like protein
MRIETKMNAPAGANAEARALTAEVLAAFEALKSANAARIEEIEERAALDPLLEGKLKKIEQSLDRQCTALERLALEQSRPLIGDDPRRTDPEHTPAWSEFRANALFVMNRRTLSGVRKLKDADGNYLWRSGGAGEAASVLGYPVTRSRTSRTSRRMRLRSRSATSGAAT